MLIHDATSCSSHSTETAPETTKKEVAIQLYSVRDLVKDGSNLDQILKDLADMGYTSVEAANYNDGKFYGKTPQEFKQMVKKKRYEPCFLRTLPTGCRTRNWLRAILRKP